MLRLCLCMMTVSLFVTASATAYSQEPYDGAVVLDLLKRMDWNFTHIRTGDVAYTLRQVPTQYARQALNQAQREYPQNPSKLTILRAFASSLKASVRLRFREARYRYDIEEEGGLGRVVFAFDGKKYWLFNPAQREGSLVTERLDYNDPRFPILAWDEQSRWSNKISHALRHKKLRQVGTSMYGETRLLVVTFSDPDTDGEKILYFNPSRNYLLQRIDELYRGKISSRYEVVESVKVNPDAWFPVEIRATFYDATGTPLSQHFIKVSRIRVDANLPEDIFLPDFPVGTRVSDRINNRVYIVTSPAWTFRRTLLALAILALLFGFWWWRYRLPGKRTAVR